jgi:hypothetical protein
MNSNSTTLSVDERIDEILLDMYCAGVGEGACYDTDPAKSNYKIYDKSAKYNLKSLIRQVCLEVIGQNVPTGKNASKHRFQNTLRNEQRTKLNKILGEGK